MKHKFKKKFGQNFLQNHNILEKIVSCVDINDNDLVIEIGPGSGNLTEYILKYTNKLICYEIDNELKNELQKFETMGAKIVYDDFLKRNILEDIKDVEHNNIYIISNLPYYITTPIIEKIIDSNINIKSCVFMVQKEVADRFLATPNSKNYNSLTIFLNYYFNIEKIINVPRECFYPIPNVDSTVVKFNKIEDKYNIVNKEKFFQLIRDSFKYKRKTLKNNLSNYNLNTIEKILNKYNLDLSARAETIPLEVFVDIYNNL